MEHGNWEKVRVRVEKATMVAEVARMEERTHLQNGSGKKGSKEQEKGGKGETRACWTCGKIGHIAAWCQSVDNKNLYATNETDDEDMIAWCLLEEREK